jgi:hypothetical protein
MMGVFRTFRWTGAGGLGSRIPARTELVVSLHRHEPVLAALRKLTGKDLGYDQAAWRRWFETEGAAKLGLRNPAAAKLPSR